MKMSDILKNLFILCCCISFCCATTWMTPVERNVTHNVFTCSSNSSTSNAIYTIQYNGSLLFNGPFYISKNVDKEKFKVDIGDKSTNLTVKLDEQDCGVNVSCQYKTEISIKEEKIICKKPLGDRCTDINQCADMNSTCIEAVGNQTCQCISTHYNDSGICKIKKPLGDRCTDINQCADMNSTCIEAVGNQTCQCISTHYNDSGICKIKKPLGDRCTDSNQCADMNSKCKEAIGNQTCQCRSTHYNDSGSCQIRRADSGIGKNVKIILEILGILAIVVLCIVGFYKGYKRWSARQNGHANHSKNGLKAEAETGSGESNVPLFELTKTDVPQPEVCLGNTRKSGEDESVC